MEEVETTLSPLEAKQAEVEAKAEELSKKIGRKVLPFIFTKDDEFVVGFIKDPDRIDKMKAIDLYENSRTQSGAHIIITSLIKEESDKRITSEEPENDGFFLGAIEFAIKNCVMLYQDRIKKK